MLTGIVIDDLYLTLIQDFQQLGWNSNFTVIALSLGALHFVGEGREKGSAG